MYKYKQVCVFLAQLIINYPKSCANEYFKGFQNFRLLFLMTLLLTTAFIYSFGLFSKRFFILFSIINLESSFSLNLSVLFVHLIILNVALYLILKLIKIDYVLKYDLVLISFLNLIFPMSKWGIFEPSK